ncbi:ABC transporter ATP-binding protein [Limnochorda pilosa]|uniref:Heme ABC transporter ATP-binding protein n=1 Tax=Limnochorda pilosa TaxID=1555112 RepID=A0A0K2SM32_LIMPI|nr:ABC transporter ATP-binding protein [Limnochorda pilosa]BAS27894.1 heme ABC transporter ATP-binding protein [Limnochorda pilosa]
MPEWPPGDVPAVAMQGIVKRFPSVLANDRVDFSANQGEIHALVGENGAGKSTLMHILAGILQPDAGEIHIFGKRRRFRSAAEAAQAGIGMVHQHFMLVPSLSVLDNLLLGNEDVGVAGWLRRREARERITRHAEELAFGVDLRSAVGSLPVAMQQQVEVLKCLLREARVMIFDEPTSVLTPQETAALFTAIRRMVRQGRTVILISHKLREVLDLAGTITVLRDGRVTGTVRAAETSERELARLMVGREIHLPRRSAGPRPDATDARREEDTDEGAAGPRPGGAAAGLEVADLIVPGRGKGGQVGPLSLSIRPGEIVGVAAVARNGQQELVEAVAGLRPIAQGQVVLDGVDLTRLGVRERRQKGLAYIPQDRRGRGAAPALSVLRNAMACQYRTKHLQRAGWLRMRRARTLAEDLMDAYQVRAPGADAPVQTLSGGNLQKLVVGREIATRPRVLLAEDPTQGVDIGAVEFIRRILLETAAGGCGVLLVSQDLGEVLALSHRVLVLFEGRLVGERRPEETSEEEIGLLMAGGGHE